METREGISSQIDGNSWLKTLILYRQLTKSSELLHASVILPAETPLQKSRLYFHPTPNRHPNPRARHAGQSRFRRRSRHPGRPGDTDRACCIGPSPSRRTNRHRRGRAVARQRHHGSQRHRSRRFRHPPETRGRHPHHEELQGRPGGLVRAGEPVRRPSPRRRLPPPTPANSTAMTSTPPTRMQATC